MILNPRFIHVLVRYPRGEKDQGMLEKRIASLDTLQLLFYVFDSSELVSVLEGHLEFFFFILNSTYNCVNHFLHISSKRFLQDPFH